MKTTRIQDRLAGVAFVSGFLVGGWGGVGRAASLAQTNGPVLSSSVWVSGPDDAGGVVIRLKNSSTHSIMAFVAELVLVGDAGEKSTMTFSGDAGTVDSASISPGVGPILPAEQRPVNVGVGNQVRSVVNTRLVVVLYDNGQTEGDRSALRRVLDVRAAEVEELDYWIALAKVWANRSVSEVRQSLLTHIVEREKADENPSAFRTGTISELRDIAQISDDTKYMNRLESIQQQWARVRAALAVEIKYDNP
jgi:hypothetical protein